MTNAEQIRSPKSQISAQGVSPKTSSRQKANFEQNDPHPDPLPSDGRGNSQTGLSQLPKRLGTPTDGGRYSLSHPMGEGRGEGEGFSISEVVFARAPIWQGGFLSSDFVIPSNFAIGHSSFPTLSATFVTFIQKHHLHPAFFRFVDAFQKAGNLTGGRSG